MHAAFRKITALLVLLTLTVGGAAAAESVRRHPGDDAEIRHKLRTIVLPRIDFEEATIHQAVRFLRQRSRELDPEKRGINLVLHLRDENRDPARNRITLELNNVPLGQAIMLLCFVSDLHFHIEPHAVIITDRRSLERE